MAAHRKHKQRPLTGPAGRTAATLALAGAATATAGASAGSAHAEPRLTAAQVKSKVDKLYEQAEAATERYNGAKEKADDARDALNELRDEATRRTERLNSSRAALGSIATAQYRAGGLTPTVQLALNSDPDTFLQAAALAERTAAHQSTTVTRIRKELATIAELRTRADDRLVDLKARQNEVAAQKATVQKRLTAAEDLLDTLTAQERARYAEQEAAGQDRAVPYAADGAARTAAVTRAARTATRPATQAPSSRAAAAVAFAYAAIGKPYVWGATGPGSFDCSGLTQAAWRAAGVALPRTTYTQINAGRRVSRAQLAPGDLVFFYSGISHVGIYIGDGKMIHAPRTGSTVRIAPLDQMPFAGATRPV
ncbi:C40 family peptidase [Streptomyces liangshanensis]|uniref:NlpC/P60 family protein n=1 Tax=Streptomyces liangshanensis TaxID=2717324 RepID=A0A6G9GYG3_9ACTN|nr:C40 family peptidase [Streptomyces liangshanensis]QIQ03096.1 NlpC/P60 family protein [Streptomyces liangshanensis]